VKYNSSSHGTHATSSILQQPGTSTSGIAQRVHGIIIPICADGPTGDFLNRTQLDLAHAIWLLLNELTADKLSLCFLEASAPIGVHTQMNIKPNFFIIGAAKAATTSLSSLLSSHPEAGIVRPKEPNFFSYDRIFETGWEKYLRLYSHCAAKRAIGDASTSYSRIRYFPNTIGRIKQYIPNAKIIYMVRHPLKRMESAYIEHMCTRGNRVFTSINDAVRREPMIIDSSRHWEVFDAYRKQFSEPRIKIVWFEDYISNTEVVFRDVCRFLEIDCNVNPSVDSQERNSRLDAPIRMAKLNRHHITIDTEWDQRTKQYVVGLVRDDCLRFLKYFGRQADFWEDLL
jgi:Sulfotransferase family